MNILTAAQMRAAELRANEEGLTFSRMMENAGSAVARFLRGHYGRETLKNTVILCGAGNNGGDGFVIARRLLEEGSGVSVILACGKPRSVTAIEMFDRLSSLPVTVVDAKEQGSFARRLLGEATLVVDAVFGTGFHGDLPATVRELFAQVEGLSCQVAAVDLPSGVCADTGDAADGTLLCRHTVTFHGYKNAHVLYPARRFCGSVQVADIGIPPTQEDLPFVVEEAMVRSLLARPADNTHKGAFGKACLLVGSEGMAGAAALAVRACLRCGVGLAVPIIPRAIYPLVVSAAPEAVYRLLEPSDPPGRAAVLAAGANAVLAGCGLGVTADTKAICRELVLSCPVPLVLDADGINSICGHIDVLQEREGVTVLTPHPGEMARLLKTDTASVQADRLGSAARFARQYGAMVVLKGAGTVIASPDGRLAVSLTGNSGLSKAGSGDVLAGMLVSFLAQGMAPFESACAAVWLHGRAGEMASQTHSRRAVLPTDVIEVLPSLFLTYEE